MGGPPTILDDPLVDPANQHRRLIRSPASIPASAAGLAGSGSVTMAASGLFIPRLLAISVVTDWTWMPIQPRTT